MKPWLHAFTGSRLPAAVRPLSVAVVYEDSETHRRATAACEFLVRELDENADLTATWWRTSLLNDPKLSRAAARAIGGSDLILLSVHGEREPTAPAKAWVESWPSKTSEPPQLIVLLFEPGHAQINPGGWGSYLGDLAARRGMSYAAGALSDSTGFARALSPDPRAQQSEGGPWTVQSRETEPYAHWGLNE